MGAASTAHTECHEAAAASALTYAAAVRGNTVVVPARIGLVSQGSRHLRVEFASFFCTWPNYITRTGGPR